ncbi:holo-ACP synthase [Alicyclobacillus sp. SO9]|uniref:holo-ACP synthase n=1 Tax=Alicyclobacillus sp. SO9 TaxID=2665646 RepID=UPI0018E77843|nr:holo-ACP synthase [Alicyclobacillus sp. SO9]QQE81473.1 holo-ACP synthase [Alicyclobacillus sp. SO9]
MIAGIGTDIVEIQRIQDALTRLPTRFPKRLLSGPELGYWETLSKRRRAEFLAGRFAAKEAMGKALGLGLGSLHPQQISIMLGQNGLEIEWLDADSVEYSGDSWHVSISHSDTSAVAFAIWEKF